MEKLEGPMKPMKYELTLNQTKAYDIWKNLQVKFRDFRLKDVQLSKAVKYEENILSQNIVNSQTIFLSFSIYVKAIKTLYWPTNIRKEEIHLIFLLPSPKVIAVCWPIDLGFTLLENKGWWRGNE